MSGYPPARVWRPW